MKATTAMLADGARQGRDGKLYIFGGVWDRIFALTMPTTHTTMALVVVLEVGYNEALSEHQVDAVLLREDGEVAGPRAQGVFTVGHPPGLAPGAAVTFPIVMEHQALVFNAYGRYAWVVEVDGEEVARLPLTVAPLPFQPKLPTTKVYPETPEPPTAAE